MTTTWRSATTDPPATGARVLVLDGEEIRTITWSEKAAVRFSLWLPREALP